jgi:hypothetical protein
MKVKKEKWYDNKSEEFKPFITSTYNILFGQKIQIVNEPIIKKVTNHFI